MKLRVIKTSDPLRDPAVLAVRDRLRAGGVTAGGPADVSAAVNAILTDVRQRGDAALIDLTERFEGVRLTPEKLRVGADEIAAAHRAAQPEFLDLVRRAAANIRRYQESILVPDPSPLKRGSRELAARYTPIDRAGVYVPGGRALYPSTVLMTVIPAQVAGVREIAMVSPPTGGDIEPMVLALAGELGVGEVYRISGTAGIAALAFGTASVRAVQKIVGPGNAYIAEAKRQVSGRVGIDSIAGPSEVLIVADRTARADWLAADLIAQAEHDPGSAVLVTPSAELAEAVAEELAKQAAALERKDAILAALEQYSALIVVKDMESACRVANEFAAEHLQIVTSDDEAILAGIRNAGAIFIGPNTPVPLGDYYAGPSHVLPTGGTAKFFGPLSCNDFRKSASVICYDAAALAEDADDVIDFARREGLTAHARAIEIRRKS